MPWYDWIAVAASIVTCGYVVIAYPEMIQDIAATSYSRILVTVWVRRRLEVVA